MIHFLMCIFKWLQHHSIYFALKDARDAEWALEQPVAYCHVTRDANYFVDGMAKWALEA